MQSALFLFVLGVIIGSFLNVVALRYNSGLGLFGRSFCSICGRRLSWFELMPIVSFLLLRGRCRKCRAKISWQYPLVELWTGLIFMTVPLLFLPVFCLYIIITVYDLRHKIIPDPLVYLAIILSLLIGHSLLAGLILFAMFAGLWLITHGRAIGFGDAKLALSIGLLLGAQLAFSAIALSFWIGALFGIGYMIFSHKKITMKSEIPFAPFIILGAWLATVFQLDLLHVSLF